MLNALKRNEFLPIGVKDKNALGTYHFKIIKKLMELGCGNLQSLLGRFSQESKYLQFVFTVVLIFISDSPDAITITSVQDASKIRVKEEAFGVVLTVVKMIVTSGCMNHAILMGNFLFNILI